MGTEITTAGDLPMDARTGLILPLSKSLGSRALAEHSAMVAFELEVLSKKMDRFGWDRDRNTPAQDRLIADWIEALRDYPLDEVRAACRQWVKENPTKMPNEGGILALISNARREFVQRNRKYERAPDRGVERVSKEAAARILAEAGFGVRRMQGDD